MASNPLPPNFGADLARKIRESVSAGLAAGGIGVGGMGGNRGAGGGGGPRPRCRGRAAPTDATTSPTLTPEEQVRRARGAMNLSRHETPETRDMTNEQLQRLVMLQKIKLQRIKLERIQRVPPVDVDASDVEDAMDEDGAQHGQSSPSPADEGHVRVGPRSA